MEKPKGTKGKTTREGVKRVENQGWSRGSGVCSQSARARNGLVSLSMCMVISVSTDRQLATLVEGFCTYEFACESSYSGKRRCSAEIHAGRFEAGGDPFEPCRSATEVQCAPPLGGDVR